MPQLLLNWYESPVPGLRRWADWEGGIHCALAILCPLGLWRVKDSSQQPLGCSNSHQGPDAQPTIQGAQRWFKATSSLLCPELMGSEEEAELVSQAIIARAGFVGNLEPRP